MKGEQFVGRRIFGADAVGYSAGRPEYPEALYTLLAERAGLAPGIDVFEIGPGTGQASRRLLAADVGSLTLIEPDPVLAAQLEAMDAKDGVLNVVNAPLEHARLALESFDLGTAATAFHWIDQARGLEVVSTLLKPGGHWAMWWNVVHDPVNDPFSRAVLPVLSNVQLPPSLRGPEHLHYSLLVDERLTDLGAAGFADAEHHMLSLPVRMTARQMRSLYATFSMIRQIEPGERERVLDAIETIGFKDFGDVIDRRFLTPLYIARKSGAA